MPIGPTISRTDAAAKPREANARAASSRSCGRRLWPRRRAGSIFVLERQTLVWSSGGEDNRGVSRFSSAAYLLARARTPEPPELAEMAWLPALLPNERERALADLKVVQVEVGELLCRVGRPVTYWFGVVDGLLKMSNDTAMGVPVTFTGIAPGGWFGEGTVIKREA